MPAGGKGGAAAVYGYAAADTAGPGAQAMRQRPRSRENVMEAGRGAGGLPGPPALLPGIKINTGQSDFRPVEQLRLLQFDGRSWQPIGDVLETAFADTRK